MNNAITKNDSDRPLSEDEAAVYLQLSPTTLAAWRSRSTGPTYVKYSHKEVRYLISDLDSWIVSKRIDAATKTPAAP
jgi:predicted DNA-binding transcriptional regulator AlpA